ncbi:MAG: heptaprenyl diphosphate synthase component II [Bacillaceae bacterium]|nr:heptaprenyl diphosphate synthase component II [Bacillaceae bacterium]
MKLSAAYPFIKEDLKQIEDKLYLAIQADHPVLREASTHLLKAGGKRIRPVFVLLSSQFGEVKNEHVHDVAAALELIHMATLVHDDVIDDAETRRGKETVKAKWDNRTAMYTGDYIFARALETLTGFNSTKIHKILSNVIVEVCLGEIEQIKDKFNFEQNFRTYLRRIKRKTALLIAVSCQLGAVAAGASEKLEKALYRYGYYVGMSYQIIDDILDFTSTEEELGKPAGSDLMQGNITLPVLYAMNEEAFKTRLQKCLSDENTLDMEQLQPIIDYIKKSEAIPYAYRISDLYLEKAYDELKRLPDNQAKKALKTIAKYIGKRKF